MRARKYHKKIELWQTTSVSDGYGGNGVTNELIASSWCNIVTENKMYRSTEFGATETADTIVVQLRKRNDLTYDSKTQFFRYRGVVYDIQSEPVNIGFDDREIQIKLISSNIIFEIKNVFDQTFDITFK
jgi:SPP1 family predicted phage head-tail adaptor